MSAAKGSVYTSIGDIVGALAALITFISVYIGAIGSVGWVIGIALGWIAAAPGPGARIVKYPPREQAA